MLCSSVKPLSRRWINEFRLESTKIISSIVCAASYRQWLRLTLQPDIRAFDCLSITFPNYHSVSTNCMLSVIRYPILLSLLIQIVSGCRSILREHSASFKFAGPNKCKSPNTLNSRIVTTSLVLLAVDPTRRFTTAPRLGLFLHLTVLEAWDP